jgi:hypothetical protein
MMDDDIQDLTPLGVYNFRHQQKKFGIKLDDRRRHIYVIGKTGVGKTTLLENMAIADMRSGKGLAFVDPHGESAEKLLDFVPENRLDDVIYFDPSDMEFPIAFNPMEQVGTEYRHLVASGLMGVFKKIWADAWSARMQYILNNTLLALLENPGATLLGILRMFSNPDYRKQIVDNLKDPIIKAFWQDEFSKYSQRFETEALAAIQNKVGQFVSNPLVRNILGQPHSTLDMRNIMDSGKIFICNLSKGKIGEDNSALLGAMIITRLQLAAMSRVDTPEQKRRDFFLYVDEFQNFATESFTSILSEARKYHLSLVLAHQYIAQLISSDSTSVRDAVFGNVGTIISFRVGAADAEYLEQEFMPEFLQNDFVNLSKANVYIKLMIDGVSSRPFSAETLPPQKIPLESYRDVIIKNSREHYGTPKSVVESQIASEWRSGPGNAPAARPERQQEKRLSEVLGPGRSRTAPDVRNVRDVERRPVAAAQEPLRPAVAAVQEEKRSVPEKAPENNSHADGDQIKKKVMHPNVDIDALKQAIHHSLEARSKNTEPGFTLAGAKNAGTENVHVVRVPVIETTPAGSKDIATQKEEQGLQDGAMHLSDLSKLPQKEKHGIAAHNNDRNNGNDEGGEAGADQGHRAEPVTIASSENEYPDVSNNTPNATQQNNSGSKIDIDDLRKAIGEIQKKRNAK